MKKRFLSMSFSCFVLAVSAQTTVTTVNSGNATNPFTWDCMCIPVDGNNIVINHAITLDSDFAITGGSITVNSTGSITGNSNARILAIGGGGFSNAGTVTLALMYHSGGTFVNNSSMTITRNMGVDLTAQMTNNSQLNVNDTFLVNTNAGFQNNGVLITPEIGNVGAFTNTGTVTCDNFANSGVLNNNNGAITVSASVLSIGTISNNAPMTIGADFFNAENVVNTNFISCANLYNGDTINQTAVFTNNGTVSVSADFANSRTVDGTGHFCVGGTSTNIGAINGTLDFCDLTGGSIDLNVGTVAGTVTYCSTSCSIGVAEVGSPEINMYPNPVSDKLTVVLNGSSGTTVSIINSLGQCVFTQTTGGQMLSVSVEDFATGVYSIVVANDASTMTSRFVKQ